MRLTKAVIRRAQALATNAEKLAKELEDIDHIVGENLSQRLRDYAQFLRLRLSDKRVVRRLSAKK